ncbi:MAG TPA: hypothetical protein VN494_00325 [Patescibacteria group bacterium]|nr:hypothetical protein [Patescibacteria group bacterium]
MPWPTPQDYNEALQNPRMAFSDHELRAGQAEADMLGLPRARSGSFATVYKLRCGQRDWAVRCFLREFPDQEERYAAIHDHLQKIQVPHMVLFQFLRQGIHVRGSWYPIVKMEWLSGESLDSYVKRNVRDPSALRGLASRWLQMLSALQRTSITHGDLQHGNILIINGEIKLIDYDGMFVPALAGRGSHEVGHRNYQHPRRTEGHFGMNVDNFSAWVIGLALIALSADSSLWDRFQGGDEALLFRREDFERPEKSALFRVLQTSTDSRTRLAAQLFESLLQLPPDQVPSLDGNIIAAPAPRAPVPAALPTGLDWIKDHLPSSAVVTTVDSGQPTLTGSYANLTWIFDWETETLPLRDIWFMNSPAIERLILLVSTIVLSSAVFVGGVDVVAAFYGLPVALLVLMNAAFLFSRYRLDPAMNETRDLLAQARTIDEEIGTLTAEIQTAASEKDTYHKEEERRREQILGQHHTLERQEQLEVERVEASVRAALSAADQRWNAIRQMEAQSLQKIQNDLGTRISSMQNELRTLTQGEAVEIANRLHALQVSHIQGHLSYHRIETASIPGVGAAFKARLSVSGFRTAADVNYHAVQRVQGIKHSRAAAIEAWRATIEADAKRTMPTSLPAAELASIRANYQGRQRQMEQDIAVAEPRRRAEESAVRARSQAERAPIEKERTELDERKRREIEAIRSRYRPQYAVIPEELRKLTAAIHTKMSTADQRIQQITAKVGTMHFQKEKVRREAKRVAHINFPNYLKRVLFGLKVV